VGSFLAGAQRRRHFKAALDGSGDQVMDDSTRMPSPENLKTDEVFSFPDLVYKEFIAILLSLAVLTVWSVWINAPLKSVADPNWTENPAKAPWYFVGLQELLVYFDPWIAGVCVPALIIVGLACIPYIDRNPKGVGSYNFKDRKAAVVLFLAGYIFWFVLIFIGQFLRGPSWHFYWPWEDWATPKTVEETLVNIPNRLGVVFVLLFFGTGMMLPALISRRHFRQMGLLRYVIAWMLVWIMFFVAGKMMLRLVFHIKYLISIHAFSV
jgi:hypothetical protein